LIAVVPLLFLGVAGCSAVENKAKSVASSAVNKTVSSAAEAIVGSAFTSAMDKAGLKLAGDPTCTSDLSTDLKGLTVKGTVTCSGKTTKGKSAAATFKGTVAVGDKATNCKGRFVMTVGGKPQVDKDVDVCQLAKGS
jgi:hypothetical protein